MLELASKDLDFWSDLNKIKIGLNEYNPIFYSLVQMGEAYLDDSISTLCVTYNEEGYSIDWRINKDFWNTLDVKQKTFFVAHECLHFLLDHGARLDLTKKVSGIAADIVVNEMLLSVFNFKKEDLKDLYYQLCLVETIDNNMDYGRPVEYYVQWLQEKEDLIKNFDGPSNHVKPLKKEVKDLIDKKIVKKIKLKTENLSKEERKKMKKGLFGLEGHGDLVGGLSKVVGNISKSSNNKWIRVIKEKVKSFKTSDSWSALNRRTAFLDSEVFIPTEAENSFKTEKVNLLFYIDSSGSCWDFVDAFVRAANSLPKIYFNAQVFSFDVDVYPFSDKTVFGGGGTSLRAVVEHAETQKFDAVFVLTDGEGTPAFPKKPKKWSWFLTRGGTSKHIFGGAIYNLADYA